MWAAELRAKGGDPPRAEDRELAEALALAQGRVNDLTEDQRLRAKLAAELVRALSPALR